jgi:hypothetical protein
LIDTNGRMGIIVLSDDGEEYTNQSGGYACKHPVANGRVQYFDEADNLSDADKLLQKALYGWFYYGPHNGWCCDGINKTDSKFINHLMSDGSWYWRVNRKRLADSMEAWVFIIDEKGTEGILIWANSD